MSLCIGKGQYARQECIPIRLALTPIRSPIDPFGTRDFDPLERPAGLDSAPGPIKRTPYHFEMTVSFFETEPGPEDPRR